MAAGRGSRMKNETANKPKCLVEYGGKSLIKRQLEIYEKLPIDEIAIVTGYKQFLLNKFRVKKFHNFEWHKSNMVHSLTFANQWLMRYECIISYSDIFFEQSAINSIIKATSEIALLYDKSWRQLWEKRFENPLSDAETLKLDNNNKVLEIGKKTNDYSNIDA
ncbi:MAG: NTP transferase domain-containing protein [Paracoccaceae bacterium]